MKANGRPRVSEGTQGGWAKANPLYILRIGDGLALPGGPYKITKERQGSG